MDLREHPFFQELASLRFPPDEYVIAGSGPMLAHGVETDIGDLDVVVARSLWSRALKLGHATPAPFGEVKHVVLFGGDIEILDGWFDYPVVDLIHEGQVFEGVRFSPLCRVLEWKKEHGREKDLRHIEMIENHLKGTC